MAFNRIDWYPRCFSHPETPISQPLPDWLQPPNGTQITLLLLRMQQGHYASFGVQDFATNVQQAVNRIQPLDVVERALSGALRQCTAPRRFVRP
ncbi:hypothetical protein F6X37_29710 [Paraburkholderia sp. 31.1]|uniref:hypothetical protein n=1 Tax=Paraburkholderia sp. 31.1 TaxID=2615205 RepID=UPI0016562F6E|nr:hypothetical protein [Paraburkholderia sp. 31.1]MBC8725597.1 hypothetical protein [Paraburkholderia sp. 31.1]